MKAAGFHFEKGFKTVFSVDSMQLNKTETLRQAQQLIDQGKVSSAIHIYQKIVEADSSDLAAISVLSDLYVKAGQIPEAVEHFLRIAESYVRKGSPISAANLLKKVLKLDPANARAKMNLGELYSHGKNDQAHAYFIEAGAAFWHKGNITAAIKMNERALENMPNSRQAKTALALLRQESDQLESPQTSGRITGELEPILISIPDEPDQMCAAGALQDQVQPELPSGSSGSLSHLESVSCEDEGTVVEQIARAEMLVAYGQADQAVALLREMLYDRPDHIQIRDK
jgi:tetratricopeptide (TPR) repeat protein